VTLKYIDPSYIIRATKANSSDRLFCAKLARNAVHAAMAGKTDMLVGYWHGRVTHIPFLALEDRRQTIDPMSSFGSMS
jgi:6-phosphofructokinase 1